MSGLKVEQKQSLSRAEAATLVADLAAMPHLLIGGTTGSGKSVCINCILMCFLYRFSPDDLRLILIDPKQVEMHVYNSIPHLVVPVVTVRSSRWSGRRSMVTRISDTVALLLSRRLVGTAPAVA